MTAKLVSVIIPAYKSEQYISKALDSVFRQTYSKWEVIVAEDAYADRTEYIVKEFSVLLQESQVRYLKYDINRGLGATCNTAIKNSKGEYIAYLFCDVQI